MQTKEFKYTHADFPHVSAEAILMANAHPSLMTPNGAQRALDIQSGVSMEKIVERERNHPHPEALKTKKTSHKHKTTERKGTVIQHYDKVGKAENQENAEIQIENSRTGVSDQKEKEFFSAYDLWEIGLQHFQKELDNTLHVIYTGEGHFGGFEFGLEEKYPTIKGINPPPGAKHIRTLKKIPKTLFTIFSSIPVEQSRDFWLAPISGAGYGCAISRFAVGCEDQKNLKSVSIDGETAFKMVPPLEWFAPEVLKINPISDLLAIFPQAEAESFLLHLGKLVFGKHADSSNETKSSILGFPIPPQYYWRSGLVLNGVPRVGKSTLMDEIINGISRVGYTYGVMSSEPNRFSWNKVVRDLFYSDDTTGDALKQIFRSSNLKSTISGGAIEAEKKGIDGREIFPNCMVVFSANKIIFPKDIDSGVVDRMHFLTTYTHNQILAKNEDVNENMFTGDYWTNTANRMGIEKATLALYLVRCGLEEFLREIGVTQDGYGDWIQDRSKETLSKTLNENRAKYQFRTPVDPLFSVPAICRKAHLISKVFGDDEIPACYNSSFSPFTLLHAAKTILRLEVIFKNLNESIKKKGKSDIISPIKIEFFKEIKEWLMPSSETVITEMIWLQYATIFKSVYGSDGSTGQPFLVGGKNQQFEDIWKVMIKTLTDQDGRQVEPERFQWADGFHTSLTDQYTYEKGLLTILEKYKDSIDRETDKHCSILVEPFLIFKADDDALINNLFSSAFNQL